MELYTAREARTILRVSPTTLRAMLRRGDLQGFKLGRIIRVTAESLDRLIKSEAAEKLDSA